MLHEKQCIDDMKMSDYDKCKHGSVDKENPSQSDYDQISNEECEDDDDWVTVKSRKTKWMEKIKERKLYSKSKDDHRTDRKIGRKSVNGVVLEPGVTYIGKAIKTFYESRKRKNGNRKKDELKENKNVNYEKKKDVSLQTYTETLLGIYAYSVQSPYTMKLYNKTHVQVETMNTRTWADVTSSLPIESKTESCACIHACTCNLSEQIKELRMYRVHGGGSRRKNSKGQFTKGKQGTVKNNSSDELKVRCNKDEGIELAVQNEKLNKMESVKTCDQGCVGNKIESTDHHSCNMKDDVSDGLMQTD